LVATPIGNLGDITLRALDLLRTADLIACEDTRVTAKLLTLLGVGRRKLVSFHDHNADKAGPALLARLKEGASIVLVSDAGTPLISDPGFPLVRACVAEGLPVTAAPGPSAPLAALQLSGLPAERFCFAGFLPARDAARRKALAELAGIPATLIFLESTPRLAAALGAMAAVLGNRPAAVARELTKLYEEVRRAPLADLAAHYHEAGPPKGEVVVVVGPPPPAAPPGAEALDDLLRRALATASSRDAAAAVAAASGLPRRTVYARALALGKPR
jgi:16S rRNA (cytidine1402-2'-O)-methyltransferase